MNYPALRDWAQQHWSQLSGLLFALGCAVMLVLAHTSLKTSVNFLESIDSLTRIADQTNTISVLLMEEENPGESYQLCFDELTRLRVLVNQVSENSKERDDKILEISVSIETSLTSAERIHERFNASTASDPKATTELIEVLNNITVSVTKAQDLMGDRTLHAHQTAAKQVRLAMLLAGFAVLLLSVGMFRFTKKPPETTDDCATPTLPSLLTAAIRSADEGILITDTGSKGNPAKIIFANESFKHLTGILDEDLIGRDFDSLHEKCFLEKEFSLLQYSRPDSQSTTMETVRRKNDGSVLYSEWHISPVRGEANRVTHYISILRDVTSLREHEEAQQRIQEELREANRKLVENQDQLIHSEKMAFLGQIAAGVAHEVNNPLGFVMSYLEMLLEDLQDIEPYFPTIFQRLSEIQSEGKEIGNLDTNALGKVEKYLRELSETLTESFQGLDRVNEIVQGLKNFARPADSNTELTDINHEIEEALKIVNNEIKGKCTVQTDFQDLPLVRCRPGQLNQVFTNLLANAAQAMVGWGEIQISTQVIGKEILVSVADDGEGIDEDNMSKLFSPFFTTKPTGKGTGLGLAVSYGIVKNHNGIIEVKSKRGEGTTFTVRLPLKGRRSC